MRAHLRIQLLAILRSNETYVDFVKLTTDISLQKEKSFIGLFDPREKTYTLFELSKTLSVKNRLDYISVNNAAENGGKTSIRR